MTDGIHLRFPDWLVSFLQDLPGLLATIGDGEGDPAADRFDLPVYLNNPTANAEWQRWMASELDESRAADRSAFAEILAAASEGVDISTLEAHAMLRVLGEARLVLAARAGVDVESDYADLDDHTMTTLDTLAHLQETLIDALEMTDDS